MVFNSAIFLICFLPLFFLCYYLLPARFRNAFLLVGSLGFYAWGDPGNILLLLAASGAPWLRQPRRSAASADLAAAMQENGLLDGVVLPAAEDFAWQDLDCPYRGDLNRRFSYLFSMQEEVPYYSIRETSELQYYDAKDVEVPRESIWARGLQSGEEMQYNLLSTENLGFYRICNPNARSARRVLILKDSMEDPMTDYWAELFSEIIVIDPRSYLREESLPELVAEYDIDMALFLYHQNNLSEELIDFLNRGE